MTDKRIRRLNYPLRPHSYFLVKLERNQDLSGSLTQPHLTLPVFSKVCYGMPESLEML